MKRLCGILLALAGLFLYAPCAAQNTRVRGTVTDAQTGEPIPYAVVLFPGTTTGITTDDEGFYSLESRDTSSYIRAEMVSYEPQIRPVHVGGYNQIDFRLTPSHLEIESVVITPGDNPAHPILEGIIRNKKYNDSKEYDRYICRTYTKMELGLANIREFRSKKLQQNFGFIFEHLDTSSGHGTALPARDDLRNSGGLLPQPHAVRRPRGNSRQPDIRYRRQQRAGAIHRTPARRRESLRKLHRPVRREVRQPPLQLGTLILQILSGGQYERGGAQDLQNPDFTPKVSPPRYSTARSISTRQAMRCVRPA